MVRRRLQLAEEGKWEQLVHEYNLDCQWIKQDRAAAAVRPQEDRSGEEMKVRRYTNAVCKAAQGGFRRVLDRVGIHPPCAET